MALMLLDHMWVTVMTGNDWMTCAGRVAFPIFAFMIAEGYAHTRDVKKYMRRMLFFALIAELPFNLMTGGAVINPLHQNVLWTFLIALCGIRLMERAKGGKFFPLAAAGIILASFLIGMVTMVDYMGFGVLTVYAFWFFRRRDIVGFLGQLVCLWLINVEMLGGLVYPVMVFGREILIHQQGFALLALIPIWLYKGRQGYKEKWFKYFCYIFYPAHMLILSLIAILR
ncbi:MAG: conjugal transfer protein TraX [Oscillospiraceae bacterium]|nr:conjugal transfer protein TraX [Oscillospiraceae bacterium]